MRAIHPKNYRSVDMTSPLTGEATPPAAAALLLAADEWCVGAAVSPYAGCGHVFDGLTASGLARRYLAAVIAPGAVHARAALSRTWEQTTAVGHSATEHELWSSDSGSTANELINVPGKQAGVGYTPQPTFQYGASDIVLSGDGINDSPTASQDRQLELQTLAAPYVEPLYVGDVSAFSLFVSDQVLDLETL